MEDANFSSPLQESMQKMADFLRGITEVVPWDQSEELVPGWKLTVLDNIARFGVKWLTKISFKRKGKLLPFIFWRILA